MLMDFSQALLMDLKKYQRRGYPALIAVFLIYAYFIYLPPLAISLYQQLPQYSYFEIFAIGSFLLHLSIYTFANLLFFIAYKLKNPIIESWKVNKEPWPWESDKQFSQKLRKVAMSVLINNVFVIIPTSILGARTQRFLIGPDEFKGNFANFWQIVVFLLCEDFCFYWAHRILHIPFLYRKIHKQHHEFNVTISVASEYTHPIEYWLGNVIPMSMGSLILYRLGVEIHIVTWLLWVTFRSFHTIEGHSGYHIPWSPIRFLPLGVSADFHDHHHLKNKGNFSSMFVIWDTICGTNQEIKEKMN